MLSIFPELLVFSLAAPLLLRIVAGGFFLLWSVRTSFSEKNSWEKKLSAHNIPMPWGIWLLAALEGLAGLLLFVGLWTQVAALVAVGIAFYLARLSQKENGVSAETLVYLLVGIISLSLAFSGAGFLAFDLPL